MQILKSTLPIIVELSDQDIHYLHLACHYYKALLKHSIKAPRHKRRERLHGLNRMITLIDLLL